MSELVGLARRDRHRALDGRRAFGDDHDRERLAARVPVPQPRAHLLDVERLLGNEDDVGAAREPGVRRDPARVPAHHLDHHHAVVALGRRLQPVDRVGRDLHRGPEAEGVVGGRQVVVDRLRHADDVHARGAELRADAERVVTADRDRARRRRRVRGSRRTCATPSSVLYGFVREVPRMVPPRVSRPFVDAVDSGMLSPSSTPRQPWRYPMKEWPYTVSPLRTTARMTALRPGQSPPPVNIPIRMPFSSGRRALSCRESEPLRGCHVTRGTPNSGCAPTGWPGWSPTRTSWRGAARGSREPATLQQLAARWRDVVVVTDRRLLLFSVGHFTRRPRRRVLADRLDELTVDDVGTHPGARLRCASRPPADAARARR